jgi:hypothetical protein
VPAPGTFADVSLNLASAFNPCPGNDCIYSNNSGLVGPFDTWTSGTFAPELGANGSYLCWGGGHNAYSGNEVYRYDIATRLWSRMGNPSLYSATAGNLASDGSFPDGTPAPPHSYQTLGIRSSANGGGIHGSLVQATQSFCNTGGGSYNGAWWQFNLATSTWSKFIDSSTISAGTLGQRLMVQEPGSHFWWFGGGYVTQIARVTQAGVVTKYNIEVNSGNYRVGAVIPNTRIAVVHGQFSTLQTWLYDLAAIEAGGHTASATKAIATTGQAGPQDGSLTWCPDLNGFANVEWGSPTTVRWLKPSNPANPWNSTWAWTSESFTAASGSSVRTISNGAHGRFHWCPPVKCFLWATRAGNPMQLYRPAGT